MPEVVTEFVQSRTTSIGSSPQHEKIFIVRGTTDESVALTAAWNTAANSFGGSGVFPYMTKKNATVEPTSVIDANANACIWTTTITYLRPQGGSGGGASSTYSFDISDGGTKHVTQSILTTFANGVANMPANVADNGGLIGVIDEENGVRRIEGVDISSPVFNFTETHYIPNANVTDGFKANLADLAYTSNDDTFRGFETGEVLFTGASGSMRESDSVWEITYRFSVRRNKVDVPVGTFVMPYVFGWEYLWIKYGRDPLNPNAPGALTVPLQAYTEQVYEYTDFDLLGIG